MVRAGKWVKGKLRTPPPSVERRRKLAQAGLERAQGIADGQVKRMLESEHGEAHALVQAAPQTEARISAKRAQLEQLQGQHAAAQAEAAEAKSARESALSDPTVLRTPSVSVRRPVRRPGGGPQTACSGAARADGSPAGSNRRRSGLAHRGTADRAGRRAGKEHDGQCVHARAGQGGRALPRRTGGAAARWERDYTGMAGVVGYGRRKYEVLDDRGQEAARREIDSELAARKGLDAAAREVAASGEGSLKAARATESG